MSKSSANGAEREVLVGDGGGESLGELEFIVREPVP